MCWIVLDYYVFVYPCYGLGPHGAGALLGARRQGPNGSTGASLCAEQAPVAPKWLQATVVVVVVVSLLRGSRRDARLAGGVPA